MARLQLSLPITPTFFTKTAGVERIVNQLSDTALQNLIVQVARMEKEHKAHVASAQRWQQGMVFGDTPQYAEWAECMHIEVTEYLAYLNSVKKSRGV